MTTPRAVSPDALRIDASAETERILAGIRTIVFSQLKRKGAIVGLTGGIESSLVACLCARALGADRVLAVVTPDTESSPDRLRLGRLVAQALDLRCVVEDISAVLVATGCYERRDETFRRVLPDYRDGVRCRIVQPTVPPPDNDSLFSVVLVSPDGPAQWVPLTGDAYLAITAASGFKQRVRRMVEYYYADLLQYAVAGAPNRVDYDQGFFVKTGDGAADFTPIAHLYRSQVYQLADHLGVPEEIRMSPPAGDVYPVEELQHDFYLLLPVEKMDLCLFGKNNGIPPADLTDAVGLEPEQIQKVYDAIHAKREAARYLRAAPVLVADVSEVSPR